MTSDEQLVMAMLSEVAARAQSTFLKFQANKFWEGELAVEVRHIVSIAVKIERLIERR